MRTSLALGPTRWRIRLSGVFIVLFGAALAHENSQYLLRDDYVALTYVGMILVGGVIVVGLILWLLMGRAVPMSAWKVVCQLKGSPWFPRAFMIFWYASLRFVPLNYEGMQAFQDFILNAYLWPSLDPSFRLPKLALSAQFAAASTERPLRSGIR
jgi:hypothetical protein